MENTPGPPKGRVGSSPACYLMPQMILKLRLLIADLEVAAYGDGKPETVTNIRPLRQEN